MIGAIIGDMVGAPFEFDTIKTKDFPFVNKRTGFTDDTVMTIAVAETLMKLDVDASVDEIHEEVTLSMLKWGSRYPYAGYGTMFSNWLDSDDPKPYESYGNGSAMRISSVGWLYPTLDRVREVARAATEVTHNHPEGIKGAVATASAVYLARVGVPKEDIRSYLEKEFGYDLSRTIDEIRPSYYHREDCQRSVPEALICFFDGEDYEDAIRNAVSLGGDADTQACIAGAVAEAYYGIPEEIQGIADRLPEDMLEVVSEFKKRTDGFRYIGEKSADYKWNNQSLYAPMQKYSEEQTDENLVPVLNALKERMYQGGQLLVPVEEDPNDPGYYLFRRLSDVEKPVAFTSQAEFEKIGGTEIKPINMDSLFKIFAEDPELPGIRLDPKGSDVIIDSARLQNNLDAEEKILNIEPTEQEYEDDDTVTFSKMTFLDYKDYADGKIATMETPEELIPVNVYAEENSDYSLENGDVCNVEIFGESEDFKVYNDFDERNNADGMAPISMIPTGTFSPNDDPDFKENPTIYFSGKVLGVARHPEATENEYNCAALVQTYDMRFTLLFNYDGELEEGNYISGMAWLYADIVKDAGGEA